MPYTFNFQDWLSMKTTRFKNIKAVNWAINTSDDPLDIMNEFSGEYLLCPHIGIDSFKGEALQHLDLKDEAGLIQYILDNMLDNTTLYFWFQDELAQDIEKMSSIYSLFRDHGYLP